MKAYVIEFHTDHDDGPRALRAILKLAWRRYQLKCERIVEVTDQGAVEIDAHPVIESTGTPYTEPMARPQPAIAARLDSRRRGMVE